MRNRRQGLLFGPREAGCWEFLLGQAWLCALASGAAAYAIRAPALISVAIGFGGEAIGLSLFLLMFAQLFWLEERFPGIPDWCLQVWGWLPPLVILGLPLRHFFPGLGGGLLTLAVVWLLLLGLSLALRLLLRLWDQFGQ